MFNQPSRLYFSIKKEPASTLSHRNLSDEMLCKLQTDTGILVLNLSHSDINSNRILLLTDIISKNSHLISINFSGNNLGNKGVELLLNAIAGNSDTKIEILNLSDTKIDSISPNVISRFFETNKTLKTLILDNNFLCVGDDTLNTLVTSLGSNTFTPLKTLSLQNVGLQAHHVEKIISLLQSNPTIEEVILSNVKLMDDKLSYLQHLIKQTNLQFISNEGESGTPNIVIKKSQPHNVLANSYIGFRKF